MTSIIGRNGANGEDDWFAVFNIRYSEFRQKNLIGVKWRLHELCAERNLGCPLPKRECPFCYGNYPRMTTEVEESPRFKKEYRLLFRKYKQVKQERHPKLVLSKSIQMNESIQNSLAYAALPSYQEGKIDVRDSAYSVLMTGVVQRHMNRFMTAFSHREHKYKCWYPKAPSH